MFSFSILFFVLLLSFFLGCVFTSVGSREFTEDEKKQIKHLAIQIVHSEINPFTFVREMMNLYGSVGNVVMVNTLMNSMGTVEDWNRLLEMCQDIIAKLELEK